MKSGSPGVWVEEIECNKQGFKVQGKPQKNSALFMGQIYHLIITSFQNSYIWLQVFSNLVKIQKHLIKAELADREIEVVVKNFL